MAEAIEYNIREKFPNESSKARLLSDKLGISETAVYQKLSGSRRFSLEEVASIARLFSVSVDRLLNRQPHRFSHPMELIHPGNMSAEEIAVYGEETAQSILEQASRAGYSKFTGVLKNLPPFGYCNLEWLMKFSQLKWIYLNNSVDGIAPLTGMKVPGEFDTLSRIAGKVFNSFRTLLFIIDGDITRNQIKEVQFFLKIGLITVEQAKFIMDDMDTLLDRIQKICRIGHTDNPGQEIEIFYSDIPLYNDIYLVESTTVNQAVLFTQGCIPIIPKETRTLNVIRDCVISCKRSSNPICGVADLERINFFEKQYGRVDRFRKSLS
ncbi:MAG: helix-turn-helix domain-containing protein [Alistipes sp.]|nr:helix-turn-helix domain-containing protein [Alistipes sp.]